MLSIDKVKKVVNSELDHRILAARKMSTKLRLHVNGEGLQAFLERINNYENKLQYEARAKHAISNKFLTEELLRPTDNAFNARGGSQNYKFKSEGKEEDFIKKLVNVRDHSSLSEYVESTWFNKFVTDPNGLIFMEVTDKDKEGVELAEEDKKAEPCYKSIYSIQAYKQNGIYVDWVIFEPHVEIIDKENKDEKKKQFWAVDSEFYYLYEQKADDIVLITTIENSFDRVPAILCSNIIDNVTGWKKSPIDSQVELLDKYCIDNSVLNITQFFHNYPVPWEYVDVCPNCNGTKATGNDDAVCSTCNGTGKNERKDVTATIELKIPDTDGVEITPPGGFLTTPIDAMNQQVVLIDRIWNILYFVHWGASQEKNGNETATGRFIDVQPVNNRLEKYSRSIELVHTALANFLGQFYFPETFEKAFIQYGRRYLIETPDQIWEKYLKAKKDNAPTSTLDLLLSQYIESEFRDNEHMFVIEMKKIHLEPFIHWDIVTVQSLNVSDDDYKKKLYYNEWIKTKTNKELFDTELKVLEQELIKYTDSKQLTKTDTNGNEQIV